MPAGYGCGYGRTLDELASLGCANTIGDAVLLQAVLTCIPDDAEQRQVIGELRRLLRPSGLLYISDMPLQSDRRNLARYANDVTRFGIYGVFQTDDGAVVRHHDDQWSEGLLQGLDKIASGMSKSGP